MITLQHTTKYFFDAPAVTHAVDAATRRALSRFGAYVRHSARRSIVKRRGPAPPGQPPHSHKGQLRRFLFFAWDPVTKSVVVGPAPLGRARAPALLEYGGAVKAGHRKRRNRAHIDPRPYMEPALQRERRHLPTLLKDAAR